MKYRLFVSMLVTVFLAVSAACQNRATTAREQNQEPNTNRRVRISVAQYNSLGAAQLLLSRGADVNAKDRQGRTALIYAVGLQEVKINPELIQALLAKGADVNARDQAGKTALGYAVEKEIGDRAPEAVELLRKSGAKG